MITKKFMMSFLPYNYEGIEKVLSEKSSQGWQLVKAGELYWTFVQGECNEFQYNVTYVPSASEYRADDTEHQIVLDNYCANAGWERVCNYRKIQIYRNRDPLAVPIDTDEEQKLKMIHLAVKKWLLLPAWILIILFAVLLVSVIFTFFKRNDTMTFEIVKMVLCLMVFLISKGVDVLNYYLWYFKSKKSIATTGKCCSAKRADLIQNINMILLFIFVVWDCFFLDIKTEQDFSEMIFIIIVVVFYRLHVTWIKKLCKYIGWPQMVNRVFTIVLSLVLSIYSGALTWAMLVARGFLPGL